MARCAVRARKAGAMNVARFPLTKNSGGSTAGDSAARCPYQSNCLAFILRVAQPTRRRVQAASGRQFLYLAKLARRDAARIRRRGGLRHGWDLSDLACCADRVAFSRQPAHRGLHQARSRRDCACSTHRARSSAIQARSFLERAWSKKHPARSCELQSRSSNIICTGVRCRSAAMTETPAHRVESPASSRVITNS